MNHRNSSKRSDQAFFILLHGYKILHPAFNFGGNPLPTSLWYNIETAISSETSVNVTSLFGVTFQKIVIYICNCVHTILLLERTACQTNPVHAPTALYIYLQILLVSPYLRLGYPSFLFCSGFFDLYDYVFLIFSVNTALLALLVPLVLLFLKWAVYGEELMPWSPSISVSLQIYFIPYL